MNLLSKTVDFLLPRTCALCRGPVRACGNICADCINKTPLIDSPVCTRCGHILAIDYDISRFREYLCSGCRCHPPCFDKAAAAARYDGIMKQMVAAFKYQRKNYIGRDIADIVIRALRKIFEQHSFDSVFHVPLHPDKVKSRGFDQSYILAESIGRTLGVPSCYGNLERKRKTESQARLNRKERKENVQGAFLLKNPEMVKGKTILLVDDVFTTGATINECAALLKKGGAREIIVVTVARA